MLTSSIGVGSFTDIIAAIFKPNLIPRFEQLKWIADFSIPTLMLHGDNDRMVPPHMSSTLYKVPTPIPDSHFFLVIRHSPIFPSSWCRD